MRQAGTKSYMKYGFRRSKGKHLVSVVGLIQSVG